MINELIRSLNQEQQNVFDVLHKFSKDFIKNLGPKRQQMINPFHIFITGALGVGKSSLIKTIHMSLNKVLMYNGGDSEKPRILLVPPTGVGAVYINATIHCGLKINIGGKVFPLNDYQRAFLRNKSEVKIIILDEVSMVSSMLLYRVNQRLNEIFEYSDQLPFAAMCYSSVDFYQLPLVRDLLLYSSTTSIKSLLTLDSWRKSKMAELTKVMRQRDYQFMNILNNSNAVHIIAENKLVAQHNEVKLDKVDSDLVSIQVTDEITRDVKLTKSQVEAIKQIKLNETGNLAYLLNLKIGTQKTVTANANIEDRLVYGLVGKAMQFKVVNNKVTVVYVKF